MPEITQEITFEKSGLNWDDDLRFFGKGDSEYRLNFVPNMPGSTFSLTNVKGNTEYTHSFTHDTAYAGSLYTVLGNVYDDNRDCLYLLIHSSGGNHSILRFNFSDQSFDKIAWDHTALGFDIAYPITDGFMIGDWLHYNPRSSSPRAINVQWAYYDHVSYYAYTGTFRSVGDYVRVFNRIYVALKNTSEGYPPSSPHDYEFVDYCYGDVLPVNATTLDATVTSGEYFRYRDFYNTPPILSTVPNAAVATDTDYEYNNVRGRRFQFCYRQYVKDQGYTISSPYTQIIAAPGAETHYGEVVRDIDAFNQLTIDFRIQDQLSYGGIWYQHHMLYEFVEVLFREGPDDVWHVAERINYETIGAHIIATGDVVYTISFYNDRSYEVVDTASVEKQYNALPITSRSQWSLDGARSAYGGNVEGFDPIVDIDVDLTVGASKLTRDGGDIVGGALDTITFSIDDSLGTGFLRLYSSDIEVGTAVAGDVITVTINGQDYQYSLTADDDNTDYSYAGAIINLLEQSGYNFYIAAGAVAGNLIYRSSYDPHPDVSSIIRYGTGASIADSTKVGSFKNGSWHPFCLFYYDDVGRRCEPVFNDDMRVYVETLPEVLDDTADSTNYQRTISWEINHEPPAWAKWWRWGYAGNQTIGKFWQYNVAEVADGEPKGGTVAGATDTWTKIDITPLQDIDNDGNDTLDHYFPNTNIEKYSFEKGDRVRFITKGVTKPSTFEGLRIAASNDDYEILSYDDTSNCIYIADLAAGHTGDVETIIIEIYRPLKQTGETVYYEYGTLYETYTDSDVLYHKGDSVDQTASLSADGTFVNGDVWLLSRGLSLEPADDNIVFVESYGWSDFDDTDGWAKGKAGVYTGIGRSYVNHVRYSNKYEPNAQSSGLSTFDFLDYKVMSTDHGKITAMRQAGNTLKVYFERNSAAVLVNKTQFYNADGVSQILKSDNVLGDASYSNYHYGTIFPESVYLKDRTVYFFDVYRDAFIQDSPNGLVVVSDHKMIRYFKEKAESILSQGVDNIRVYTTFDYYLDLVIVVFDIGEDTDQNNCMAYHPESNRWVTFLDWEVAETGEGNFISIDYPQYVGSPAVFDMGGSFSYGLYSSSMVCLNTETLYQNHDFEGSNRIPLRLGADITITAYVSAGDTSVTDNLSMLITDPDGLTVEAMTTHIGSGNTYTYTNTTTKSGYLSVSFRIGGGSYTAADYAVVLWSPSYTQKVVPLLGQAVSNLASFIDEDVWIHHSKATRNNLWGAQESSVVELVGNEAANVKKVFESMAIHSNKGWDVTEVSIPADETYVNGMVSKVPEARFVKREGVFYSDYLRNQKTNQATASTLDLVRGEQLRGYYLKHRLENTDTTEVILFKVDVSGNVSRV